MIVGLDGRHLVHAVKRPHYLRVAMPVLWGRMLPVCSSQQHVFVTGDAGDHVSDRQPA